MPSAIPLLRGALVGLSLVFAAATPGFAAPATEPAVLPGPSGALLLAQLDDIDFGDDSSQWANDGECDDPRFTGSGAAAELVDADLMKDATDCQQAYEAGTVTLVEDDSGETGGKETAPEAADIDFGDDSSQWANDGECDDPRFTGPGAAAELVEADRMKDATDCRQAFEAGTVTLAGEGGDEPADAADIDFGDDSSRWANDGECDDPRFAGVGMASELLAEDEGKDATDCRALFEAGSITLKGGNGGAATGIDDIDFGDDSSDWANDGECDDPRFAGPGTATTLLDEDERRDATDCREAYEAGTITLKGEGASVDDIDFGDDSSQWANDGECDDPRFTGPGAAAELLDSDRMKDATDCRAAFEAGTVTLADDSSGPSGPTEFDYGDDSSTYANDGECDDPRFAGSTGMAKKLLVEDEMRDATDCRALVDAGEIEIRKVYDPAYAAAGPHDSSHVDFGDDSSTYANDGECDDPRFEGPGTATTLLDSDELRDAADCREAYEAGTVVLIGE